MRNEFGIRVPGHTVLSRLRSGGMASVYLAREDRLGRLVAIKVIDERYARQEPLRKRFEREARTAASLTHPNIVPVYQYGYTQDNRPYLSMPFIEDGSLRDRLRRRAPLPVDEALAIARQIAAALVVAHARNVIHRDLKPDNVLFQGETAMLTDFGIAKVLDAETDLTEGDANPGTVRYFSPEQANEKPVDARTDVYALGVVLYEMLTGDVPIDGDSVVQLMMHIAAEPPKPLPLSLAPLQPVLDVLLAKDPAERFGSAAEVILVLQSMEQNWERYGEIERLTQGVNIARGGKGVEAHVLGPEATTLVFARGRGDEHADALDALTDDGDPWNAPTLMRNLQRRVPWLAVAALLALVALPVVVAWLGQKAPQHVEAAAPSAASGPDAGAQPAEPGTDRALVLSDATADPQSPDARPGVAVISRAQDAEDNPPARYVQTRSGP